LGQVFFEYFGYPSQFSFHRLLHIHHHHDHHLSSGAGTLGQLLAEVPSGLSLHPKKPKKKTELKVPAFYGTRRLCRVHNSATVNPILSQFNPVQILTPPNVFNILYNIIRLRSLFTYCLFNDAVSTTDYGESNNKISE
jgi:hypothetical protein